MNKTLGTIAVIATIFGSQSALAGMIDKDDFSPEQLASIKVTMSSAIAKAQAVQSGTPIKVKLQEEGKNLIYEVEFFEKDKEKEVTVDAITGEVKSESKK